MFRSFLLVVLLVSATFASIPFKNLAGDPSEFASNQLPTPQLNAQTQSSAAQLVQLQPSSVANVLSATSSIVVDSDTYFAFSFYSPHQTVVTLALVDPNGNTVQLSKYAQTSNFPIGDFAVDGTTYTFSKPVVGTYTLTMTTSTLEKSLYDKILSSTFSDCYIIVFNENTIEELTYINTYNSYTGSQIGVVTTTFNGSTFNKDDIKLGKSPKPLKNVQSAQMVVVFPDGKVVEETMSDDGLHADQAADDGIYGAMITAPAAGDYIILAVISGTADNGAAFVRTTEQVVTVIDQFATMSSTYATLTIEDASRALVSFLLDEGSAATQYRAYAEVWGVDKNGAAVAVCWIGGMSEAVGTSLTLELDLNWVTRVGAVAPFTLRNVIVQDPNTHIPVIQVEQLALKSTSGDIDAAIAARSDNLIHDVNAEITEVMRKGRRPQTITERMLRCGESTKTEPLSLFAGSEECPRPLEPHSLSNSTSTGLLVLVPSLLSL
eukprot:TRINITY_DN15_c0_g1_i1.p1 TRINITY_DN15_c0_g1~~TRINITY_DN15_c0_g1_i1.p1  ORF type:complete len:492 (-),score=177.37 TRINITY_DN15_c0_g1_i1:885-2360(-)